jgi:hypothetical protein
MVNALKFTSRSCAIDDLNQFAIIFNLLKLLAHDAARGKLKKDSNDAKQSPRV